MDAQSFLNAYLRKFRDGPEIAANVIVPIIEESGEMSPGDQTLKMDIPGVADDARIQPIGLFGDKLPPGHPSLKYFSHQGIGSPYRGIMKFVPGTIKQPSKLMVRGYPNFEVFEKILANLAGSKAKNHQN